ncbi:MAG: polyamine aminopropyltransferase [Gammaproteobacteria bacterium]|nr:MAG: polyamine aminopropyltransferase [Gammaproteobacteria bacterium]
MALDEQRWFIEECEEGGTALAFRIKAKLHEEQTPYQRIAIYETEAFGRLMAIDGFVMLTSRDNFLYHEMLSHPALYTHAAPRRVVIVGGGDCGTLREVLRHPEVEQATQVEIDERVTRLAEQYFPELTEANGDPRARLLFQDAIRWMAEAPAASADVIIVDSTDPLGPAEGLFTEAFYRDCHRVLGEGGILVQQSESPLYHRELIAAMRRAMRAAGFDAVATLSFPQPCYPSGWWTATLAGKGVDLHAFREEEARRRPFPTRYYTPEIHRGALALPPCLADLPA